MPECQHKCNYDQRRKTVPDQHRDKQTAQHHDASHGRRAAFFHMTGRAYVTNALPKLQFMKRRDHHRSQRCAYNQGGK